VTSTASTQTQSTASRPAQYDSIIIGGGVGGLATAIRLASQGQKVALYERNAQLGGKLNIIQQDGWTFDTGPSLFTMPDVARDLFVAAGTTLEAELDLIPLDPICRYFYPDGIIFDASAEMERMTATISEFSEYDAQGFEHFIDYGRRVYNITTEPFLESAMERTSDIIGPLLRRLNRPGDLARVMSPRTLNSLVSHFFKDPHMRQLFNRYATYNGSSPYKIPAVYTVIPYVEYAFGAWYPRGGMYQFGIALERVAKRVGVDIFLQSPVRQIRTAQGKAIGVELVNGTLVTATSVISNVDITTTYRHLLRDSASAREKVKRLEKFEPSLSGFVLMLGVDRRYDELAHHNIYFSNNYKTEFADIFDRLVAPRDPTIYVCATSRTDPTQAPPGGENLFILVNVPYLSPEFSWAAEGAGYRTLILDKLEQMGLTNLHDHIVFEATMTPEDLEARYGAQRGAIYGFSSNNLFATFQRPKNRATDIEGLYFAGGSVHPGGGLPLVLLSGKIVSELVLADVAVTRAKER